MLKGLKLFVVSVYVVSVYVVSAFLEGGWVSSNVKCAMV